MTQLVLLPLQILVNMLKLCVYFALLCSSHAKRTNESCSSCLNIFLVEYDESKLACNVSAGICQCNLDLLDLKATTSCVTDGGGKEKSVDLVVTVNEGNASNKYTAECKEMIEKHGPCKLEGIMDYGFKITATEIALTSVGIGFEMITFFRFARMVRFVLLER